MNISHFDVLPGRYRFSSEVFYGSALYRGDPQRNEFGSCRNGACSWYSYPRSVMFCQSRHNKFETALVRPIATTFLPKSRVLVEHRA